MCILLEKNSGTDEVKKINQEAQIGYQGEMPFSFYSWSESREDPMKRELSCCASEGDVFRWRSG